MSRFIGWGIFVVLLIVASAAAWRWGPQLFSEPQSAETVQEAIAPDRTVVELSEEKLNAVKLHVSPVAKRLLQQTRTVPGKLDYNGVQRVELHTPVDSIVQRVLVKPGDTIERGARLAVLDSSEVGLVRAEVERSRAELAIAQKACDWTEQATQNLQDLLKALQTFPKPQDVERRFEGKILGDHRQHVLAAYARYSLAEDLWADVQPLAKTGSVSATTVKQRESNRDVALEEFRGVAEQSRFDAIQQSEKARKDRDFAERVLRVSEQKLRVLLGAFSEVVQPAIQENSAADLTRYYLVAPIAGVVQQHYLADTQRVAAGTRLLVVANTQTLWVTADIRERDWPALSLTAGQPLAVRIPALADRVVEAKLNHIGGAVSQETMAVPLIAVVSNEDGLLKPGMSAWVSLPAGPPEEMLAVPAAAIMTHEGRKFVFIAEGTNKFLRRDIVTGMSTSDWLAVVSGLQAGEPVVDAGAFVLKSELLLEAEE